MKHKTFFYTLFVAIMLLTGCQRSAVTQSAFFLDTFVTITAYGGAEGAVAEAIELCKYYDGVFNRFDEDSELYRLNHSGGKAVEVSPELADVIGIALSYCDISQGRYDITIAPVMDLWDFQSKESKPPSRKAVEEALKLVDYHNVHLEGETITLNNGAMIDLGSIAKGYIADRIGEFLREKDVSGAIINLGGNIFAIGQKPGKLPFEIGIQKPFGAAEEIVGTVSLSDASAVSSGLYERYFLHNDQLYHHILDARSGYPVNTDLLSVTILSDRSVDGDALSTLCFLLGSQEGMSLIETKRDIEAIFIITDGVVQLSSNVETEYNYH